MEMYIQYLYKRHLMLVKWLMLLHLCLISLMLGLLIIVMDKKINMLHSESVPYKLMLQRLS